MSNETYETNEIFVLESPDSFGKELAKTAAYSVTATAGTLVGMILVGAGLNAVDALRQRRAAARASEQENLEER